MPVNVHSGQLDETGLAAYQVVVLTDSTTQQQLVINSFTHSHGIHFVSANVCGLFSSVFCDFGEQFPCIDPTGENPLQGMVVEIENEKEGIVTTLDETRHGLEDGDYVTFTEVKGMTELNGCEPRKISVKGRPPPATSISCRLNFHTGPYTFSIGDTSNFAKYTGGGIFQQVKVPKIINFVRLPQSFSHSILR